MDVRVGDKTATPLTGIQPVLADIQQRLQSLPPAWLQTLREQPQAFADLEQTVHHAFQQMADQVVAGLLAQATAAAAFAEEAQKK